MRKSFVMVLVVAAVATTATIASAQIARPGAAREQRAGHADRNGLLRGITLSDAEKSKLTEIHSRYGTEGKALRESLKPARQEARAARQKGDTAAARAVVERTKGDREKVKALMDRQKSDLRAALAPEHQTQFDANVQFVSQRRAEAKRGTAGKAGEGQHRGRAQRVVRQPTTDRGREY